MSRSEGGLDPVGRTDWSRDGRTLFTGAALARPADALRGVLVAAILGPAAFGTWQAIQLFWTWAGHLHLGTVNVVERELPIALRLGQLDRARRIRDVAALVTVMAAALAAALVAVGTSGPAWWLGLAIAPLHAFWLMQAETLRSERAFSHVARAALGGAVVLLLLAPAGAWLAGVTGVVAAAVAHRIAAIGYQSRGTAWRPGLPRSIHEVTSTIRSGLGYWAIVLIGLVYASADRLLVLALLTPTELGLYALALAVTAPFRLWARALEDALRPSILAGLVDEASTEPATNEPPGPGAEEPERMAGAVRRIRTLPHLELFVLAQGLTALLLPAVLGMLLPGYADAADAVALLALGAGLWLMPVGAGSLLLGRDRKPQLQLVAVAAALVNGLGAWLLLAGGVGVAGAALAVLMAEATRALLTLSFAWRERTSAWSGFPVLLAYRALPSLVLAASLAPTLLVPADAPLAPAIRTGLFLGTAATILAGAGGRLWKPAAGSPAGRFLASLRP